MYETSSTIVRNYVMSCESLFKAVVPQEEAESTKVNWNVRDKNSLSLHYTMDSRNS